MDKYRMANRIHLLRAREFGLDHSFIQQEQTRRLTDLVLCKYRHLTPYHRSAITALDLDPSENRYLLSGAANGYLCCHDMYPSRLVADHSTMFHIDRNSSPKDHHTHFISSIIWYPSDNGLFVTLALDKTLKIWDTNRLQVVDEFRYHNFSYSAHMPSTTQTSLVALAHENGDLRFIDIRTGSDTHTIHAHHGTGVCVVRWFNNSSNLVASGGPDGRVVFTDIRSTRTHFMSLDREHVLADNNRPTIRARPSTTGIAHQGTVKSLHFLPDNIHLLTLGGDHQMHLWNIQNGQRILVNYGIVPTDKSRTVMIACAQMKSDRSKSVAYVPSGKGIRIYDLFTGQRLTNLTGHLLPVNTCVYNPVSVELYSSSDDILVWSAIRKQQEEYEASLRTAEKNRNPATLSLGQVLNRDQWSDDDDEDS